MSRQVPTKIIEEIEKKSIIGKKIYFSFNLQHLHHRSFLHLGLSLGLPLDHPGIKKSANNQS